MSVINRSAPPGIEFSQWQFVHSFNMPLFFVISGMLFRVRSFREIATNALALLLIAYAMHVVGWFIKATFHAGGGFIDVRLYDDIGFDTLLLPILQSANFSIASVWFLVALAFVQLIYHFLHIVEDRWRLVIIAALIAAFSISRATDCNYFQIASLLPGTLFYSLGAFLVRLDLRNLGMPVGIGALALAMISAPLNHGCLLSAEDHCGVERLNGEFAAMMIDGRLGFFPAFMATAVLGAFGVICCSSALASRFDILAAPFSRIGTIQLCLLNGFVHQFVQPFIRVLFISDDGAASGVGIAWAVGLTMAQIGLAPIVSGTIGLFIERTKICAATLVTSSTRALDGLSAYRRCRV